MNKYRIGSKFSLKIGNVLRWLGWNDQSEDARGGGSGGESGSGWKPDRAAAPAMDDEDKLLRSLLGSTVSSSSTTAMAGAASTPRARRRRRDARRPHFEGPGSRFSSGEETARWPWRLLGRRRRSGSQGGWCSGVLLVENGAPTESRRDARQRDAA
jgi:hypothetical protein